MRLTTGLTVVLTVAEAVLPLLSATFKLKVQDRRHSHRRRHKACVGSRRVGNGHGGPAVWLHW